MLCAMTGRPCALAEYLFPRFDAMLLLDGGWIQGMKAARTDSVSLDTWTVPASTYCAAGPAHAAVMEAWSNDCRRV